MRKVSSGLRITKGRQDFFKGIKLKTIIGGQRVGSPCGKPIGGKGLSVKKKSHNKGLGGGVEGSRGHSPLVHIYKAQTEKNTKLVLREKTSREKVQGAFGCKGGLNAKLSGSFSLGVGQKRGSTGGKKIILNSV